MRVFFLPRDAGCKGGVGAASNNRAVEFDGSSSSSPFEEAAAALRLFRVERRKLGLLGIVVASGVRVGV